MTIVDANACAWRSRQCDLRQPIMEYVVEVGRPNERRKVRLDLCAFHGQAWPRIGEDPEEGKKRMQHVRVALAGKPDYARKRDEHKRKKSAFSGPIVRD